MQDQPDHALGPPAGGCGQLAPGVLSRNTRCCETETDLTSRLNNDLTSLQSDQIVFREHPYKFRAVRVPEHPLQKGISFKMFKDF